MRTLTQFTPQNYYKKMEYASFLTKKYRLCSYKRFFFPFYLHNPNLFCTFAAEMEKYYPPNLYL